MRSFLKWPGNKYNVLKHLLPLLPEGERLIEPFAGSGVVSMNSQFNKYLLGETNHDVINIYKHLKKHKHEFIEHCQSYFKPSNNKKEKYLKFRDAFNNTQDLTERAALFLYLNRHGFNGLCRYNSLGVFNVPFGDQPGSFPLKAMQHFIKKSSKTNFVQADFLKTLNKAKSGDVIYCDPPYVPLTKTANFTRYYTADFTLQQHEQLAEQARTLASKGNPVLISNHDLPITRELYQGATLHSFEVQRFISCNANTRKPVREIIAVFS